MKFRWYPALLLFLFVTILTGCGRVLVTPAQNVPTLAILTPIPTQQIALPTLTPTTDDQVSVCEDSSGSVTEVQVDSTLLTRPLAVKVYLPPCYNSERQPGYPVLYMLHGQTYDEGQWQRLGLLTTADELTITGRIVPMIIIMPYDISWSASPDVSAFGEAVMQELIPYVDGNYNTCSQRACRAIGGLSRGGNWAIYLGFSHPEMFTAIGAHSAPLFYGEIERMTNVLNTEGAISQLPDLYIDVGNKDENLSQVMAYVTLLKKYNAPYLFTEYQGYHAEQYWSAHVEDYLLWYSDEFNLAQ